MLKIAKGTVLVTIGTREGFVLAADTLEVQRDRTDAEIRNEKKQKIYQLTQYAACQLSGPILNTCSKGDLSYQYDLIRVLQAYPTVVPHNLPMGRHAQELSNFVYGAMKPFYAACPEKLEELREKMQGRETFITLHLVGYDNGRKPSLWQINFPPEGKMTEGGFELSQAKRNPVAFPDASGNYFAVGHAGASEVVAALLDPQGLVHADFRGSGPIRKYHERLKAKSCGEMLLEEAIELAKVLIEASIKYTPRELGVGGRIQLAVVERKMGFRWVSPV